MRSVKLRYGIVGSSPALERALETALRVAPTDLTVLVTGESGTGKESISKIIHDHSLRKHNAFIAINCGAIPPGTLNSELFGHEKGSFTGASSERKGYFETADEGTIFLDEISEMPQDTQAYLLRVLESGEFLRVGSSEVHKTDVRIIAASNVDLTEHMRKGEFREDLYYRLSTVPIEMPPLRVRGKDVYLLFRKFSSDIASRFKREPVRLEEDAKALLMRYYWPGNIRQLKNFTEQLNILSDRKTVDADDLLEIMPELQERNLPAIASNGSIMEEREILYRVLFDMKQDMHEMKKLIYGLAQTNNLSLPQGMVELPDSEPKLHAPGLTSVSSEKADVLQGLYQDMREEEEITNLYEEKEEELSLELMEKRMIKKALKKYKGRRKDAAEKLGISERTLYRKINQYNLN